MRSHRLAISIATLLVTGPLGAQQVPAAYPVARTVDTVTTYFGAAVPDPYRWMESLDSPDVGEWVRAENAVTMPYLAALPGRVPFTTRITALYDYPRTSVPFWEGGRWFYTRNTGLQRQNVFFSRKTIDGPEQVVIDPNKLSRRIGSADIVQPVARWAVDRLGPERGRLRLGGALHPRPGDRTELGGHRAVGQVQRSFLDP